MSLVQLGVHSTCTSSTHGASENDMSDSEISDVQSERRDGDREGLFTVSCLCNPWLAFLVIALSSILVAFVQLHSSATASMLRIQMRASSLRPFKVSSVA
jgi:hypothetical protein